MATEMTAKQLMAAPEEAFRKLVDADLRGKAAPEISKAFRAPEVVNRWYATLATMSKSVEGQLAAKKADSEAFVLEIDEAIRKAKESGETAILNVLRQQLSEQKQKDAKWRAGVLRFKTGLEEAMTEATHLREASQESIFKSAIAVERNQAQARVRLLENAIRSHRDHECDNDTRCTESHCASDVDLWSMVN